MKLKVSSWAISNPTPVILLFLLLALAGMMALGKLPIAGNPRVELPIVSVLVSQPGASTEELEGNVARRLEDAVVGVAGIKHMSTSIANGTVDLTIEFMLETPVDRAVSNVRDAVAMVRPQLPSSVSEPVVSLLDISGGALQNYMVRSDTLSEAELSRLVDERVVPRLLAVPGVGQVKREGGSQREFRVELDPARMVAANLSVGEVLRQLRGAELNAPAGMVSTGSGRLMPIRVMGASHSLAELARRPIALAGGKTVALGELGRVLDSEGEASDFALLNGQPGMGLALYKKRGASELTLASGVSSAIAQLAAEEPRLKIEQFYDGVEYTRQSFEGARDTLIEGVVLTVLVVWLFLRNLRATAIAAAAIPLSLLPTFVAMHWRGFQLDSVTLLALILVIGILVDDAIVEIENIERRIEAGETPRQAAMVGADALGLAVLAITLTIVAVFLPVSFINGVVGKYFTAFGLTTTFAVLASLVVARLLTPLMCAHWLKPKHHAKPAPSAMERGYARALSWALAHPRRALAGGGAVLLLTLGLLAMIPSGFLPKTTAASLDVQYRIAPDAPLSEGLRAAETLRHALHGLPDVSGVFAHQQSGADSGKLTLLLVPKNQRSLPQSELEGMIRKRLAALADIKSTLLLAEGAKDVNFSFVSRDPKALEAAMAQLLVEARQLPILADVDLSQGPRLGTVDVHLLPDEAARLGVDSAAVAELLRLATLSDSAAALPRIPLDGQQIKLLPRLAGGKALTVEQLRQMPVATGNGNTVPLGAIARIEHNSVPSSISRLDRVRNIQLQANLLDGATLSEAKAAIEALPAYRKLPASVTQSEYGEVEYMNEMFVEFAFAALAGLVAVYAVLVLLFNDWLQPFTIMVALPLALSGAALALLLTGHSLNLSTVIGLLMLFGIVGKNSILLVDVIVEARREGVARQQAIMQAGRDRMRPIVMTTLAMVGGMLPAAFGWGSDDGFRAPMAIAVVGGLITSTALSLLLVPVIYQSIDQAKQRWRGKAGQPAMQGE